MARREGILVVAPAWVGDLVMCQSLFMTLRQRHPATPLDVLAPAWAGPLLARMPEVDRHIALPVEHGRLRPAVQWRVAREVRRRRHGQAIVTRRSLKSALIPFLAGIPRRTGVLGEHRHLLINDVRGVDDTTHPWAVERLAVLGMEAGAAPGLEGVPWPRLRVDEAAGQAAMARFRLGAGPVVGLAPGAAFGPAKRWPLERWTELARRLTARGVGVWIFGVEAERPDGEAIAAAGGAGAVSLCGRTSLGEVIDLMARCTAVVSNDSGLMHVAAASGPRVVALFGPTSPYNTPPLDRRARVIYHALACSPCHARICPLGHHRCLRGISVDEVLREVDGEAGPAEGESS